MATWQRRALKAGIVIATAGSGMLLQTGPVLAATGTVVFHGRTHNPDGSFYDTTRTIKGAPKGTCIDLAIKNAYPPYFGITNKTSAVVRVFYTSDCKAHGVKKHPQPQDVKPGPRKALDGIVSAKSIMFLG